MQVRVSLEGADMLAHGWLKMPPVQRQNSDAGLLRVAMHPHGLYLMEERDHLDD